MAFPTKTSVFGRFSSLPPRPRPLKSENFIFIVVSPSLTIVGNPKWNKFAKDNRRFALKKGNRPSTVSRVLFGKRETRCVLQRTRWVHFGAQIIGWEELTEFPARNSVKATKLTELRIWNRTLRNRSRPVSEFYFPGLFAFNCSPKISACSGGLRHILIEAAVSSQSPSCFSYQTSCFVGCYPWLK